jgi:diacylglycerol kinase (ATP)
MKIGIVLNPASGAGKAARNWPAFAKRLSDHFGEFTLCRTEGPQDASRMARHLTEQGCELVIAAGGDGTIGETADGILKADVAHRPCLAVFPCGTGSDFARTLKLSSDADKSVACIKEGKVMAIDAGRVCYIDEHGALAIRHFVNVASLGLSGNTSLAVNNAMMKSRAPAKMVFFWHTVHELIRYKFQEVRLTLDDNPPFEASIAVVAAANGRCFGGGMIIAPEARLDNGLMEFVIIKGASKLNLIRSLRLLYDGSHVGHPAVTMLRGQRLLVEPSGGTAENAAMIEIDGEAPGRIPATFEVLPGALSVIC